MKDINALQDDISDIHSKQSALTNSSSMSNELQQIIGIGTGGVPPPHKFLVCATPTLYALYYKLIVPPPNQKVFPTPLQMKASIARISIVAKCQASFFAHYTPRTNKSDHFATSPPAKPKSNLQLCTNIQHYGIELQRPIFWSTLC